jgi:hypothetical protein
MAEKAKTPAEFLLLLMKTRVKEAKPWFFNLQRKLFDSEFEKTLSGPLNTQLALKVIELLCAEILSMIKRTRKPEKVPAKIKTASRLLKEIYQKAMDNGVSEVELGILDLSFATVEKEEREEQVPTPANWPTEEGRSIANF